MHANGIRLNGKKRFKRHPNNPIWLLWYNQTRLPQPVAIQHGNSSSPEELREYRRINLRRAGQASLCPWEFARDGAWFKVVVTEDANRQQLRGGIAGRCRWYGHHRVDRGVDEAAD